MVLAVCHRWSGPLLVAAALCAGGGCSKDATSPAPMMDAGTSPPPSTPPLVAGEGLILQDVADDGSLIAYTDATGELFVVSPDGGEPRSVATGVDKARFKGVHLVAFQGVRPDGVRASTMLDWTGTGPARDAGQEVQVRAVRASHDGMHLFHMQKPVGHGIEDLYLDGRRLVQDAISERDRFGPANDYMVLSADVGDGAGGKITWVRAYPLGGGDPVTLWPDGASNRFVITRDGARVVMAINENGDVADLALIPIGGGAHEVIVPGGSDNGFRMLHDGRTLIFLNPNDLLRPTLFDLESIQLDGSGRSTLRSENTLDIISTSADAVVYRTSFDATARLGDLRFVRADGSGDQMLTPVGREEGFTSDGAHYLFIGGAVRTASGRVSGELSVLDVASGVVSSLGTGVRRASRVSAGGVVFIDDRANLQSADLASLETSTLSGAVSDYDPIPDAAGADASRVVLAIPSGPAAGLHVMAL